MTKATISCVEICDNQDRSLSDSKLYWQAEIDLPTHGAAIVVMGKGVHECVVRAVFVVNAINNAETDEME